VVTTECVPDGAPFSVITARLTVRDGAAALLRELREAHLANIARLPTLHNYLNMDGDNPCVLLPFSPVMISPASRFARPQSAGPSRFTLVVAASVRVRRKQPRATARLGNVGTDTPLPIVMLDALLIERNRPDA
jgi:hypothetical protein